MRATACRPPVIAARERQRGVVAIMVGLSIAVLVGFVGLALDGGHLYLTKTELQNGADACALAASYELTNAPTIAPAAFERAEAAGKAVGTQNRVDFQGVAIPAGTIDVTFGTALDSGTWVTAGAGGINPPPNSKYVRCTITRSGIPTWFMQVLGNGTQTVNAIATATLAPAQTNCAVPMALCALPGGTAPDYGYVVGNWYGMDFEDTGGGNANYTGNFRWIDYFPGSPTPGCSGGGAQELACLLAGAGQCSLPPPITGACTTSGSSNPTPGCVGQTGSINSLQQGFNTRFGLYGPGSYNITASPPDFTGYAYSNENWPAGRDAYNGAGGGGVVNFKTARANHLPTDDGAGYGVNPLFYRNPYNASTVAQHASNGADRRLVVVPIIDCSSFVGTQHAPIRTYACVLLLDPYRRQGNIVSSRLEYLGPSNVAGSPCATSGIAGNSASQGPMVPALVQ